MSILQDLLNSNNPIAADTSGQLSGLAVNGVYLSTLVFSNMSGDTQGQGYPLAWGQFYAGPPVSGAWGASGNPAMYGWVLPSFDNVHFESVLQTGGTTTTQPVARAADFTWAFDANQSGQIRPMLAPMPICSGSKMIFWNQVGQQLGGSGTYCSLYFTTDGTT